MRKLLSDPYVLFSVTVAMFFERSKIYTSVLCHIPQGISNIKFGFNWSSKSEEIFERNNIKNGKKRQKRARTPKWLNRLKPKFDQR